MGLFRKKKDLTYEGVAGTAVIKRIDDAGFWDSDESTSLADFGLGSRKLELRLDVTLEGGQTYQHVGKFKVPAKFANAIGSGDTVPVYVDPDDPKRMDLNWDQFDLSSATGEGWASPDRDKQRAMVHDAMPEQQRASMVNGWVNAVSAGGMSQPDFEQAIDEAVTAGMLNPEEAAAAKARVAELRRVYVPPVHVGAGVGGGSGKFVTSSVSGSAIGTSQTGAAASGSVGAVFPLPTKKSAICFWACVRAVGTDARVEQEPVGVTRRGGSGPRS